MRQIKAFSARMSDRENSAPIERKTFSAPKTEVGKPQGNVDVYMTPSLLKMLIREYQRPVNARFLTLMKSAKAYAKSVKSYSELSILKKVMITELTTLLSEYVEVLSINPSIRITTYLKIPTVAPQAIESANLLSKFMIMANKVKKSSGIIPPRNQRDLNMAMQQFINDIIGSATSGINPGSPINKVSIDET